MATSEALREIEAIRLATKLLKRYLRAMEAAVNPPSIVEVGRRGGIARAKALTPKRRREIAQKASRASARVRSEKARARRASGQKPPKEEHSPAA